MSTFNTEALKKMVSYAVKGAGFNKLLELSNFIGIRICDGELQLSTTDGTNYLKVSGKCDAEDMNITVNADLFSKLIGKLNTDTVNMSVVDGAKLKVVGNGTYMLELVPDETGAALVFPDRFPANYNEIGKISADNLASITNTVKASLSAVAGSVYSAYYFSDIVASTDRAMMSIFRCPVFDTPHLVNKEFVELMSIGVADVTISLSNDILVADCAADDCSISVCTKLSGNINDFNIAGINKFADLDVNSFCRISKAKMLDLLDRLSLFVSKFDDGAIVMHFTDNYIEVSSIASNSVECVEYIESKNTQDITIKINIDRLRNQLKAHSSNIVDLYYGSDICIKLVDGDMMQIIALIR